MPKCPDCGSERVDIINTMNFEWYECVDCKNRFQVKRIKARSIQHQEWNEKYGLKEDI